MIDAMPRPRPPHLQRQITGHGKAVWYARIGKGPRVRIRPEFGTPEFDAEYQAALTTNPRPAKAGAAAGTFAWLIERYRETQRTRLDRRAAVYGVDRAAVPLGSAASLCATVLLPCARSLFICRSYPSCRGRSTPAQSAISPSSSEKSGKPFTKELFGNAFKEACVKAVYCIIPRMVAARSERRARPRMARPLRN